MTQEELELLEYLERNARYTSNEFGNNAFKIDNNKTLKENLELLLDIVAENAYSAAEFKDYD